MKKKKHTRTLTVYGHYSRRNYNKSCHVPYIRLCGKWLDEAGFGIGKRINVIVGHQEKVKTTNLSLIIRV